MQTFLPYPDFEESARCLDDRRLGKQRVEAMQILGALDKLAVGEAAGWQSHPAVLMWEGYRSALLVYKDRMIDEWIRRGFKNTMKTERVLPLYYEKPPWLGDREFHASHQSNLLRKDPVHYGQFGWLVPSDLPYVWPVRKKVVKP